MAIIWANSAGHFVHLMQVFGTLMVVTLLNEAFGWQHALGAALVVVGIGLSKCRT